MYWDSYCFLLGVVAGAVIAGIFGVLLRRVRYAFSTMGDRNRKQVVVQMTRETPSQVVHRSTRAIFQWLLWGVILVVFVGAVLAVMVVLVYAL
jgi:hypothetical protein